MCRIQIILKKKIFHKTLLKAITRTLSPIQSNWIQKLYLDFQTTIKALDAKLKNKVSKKNIVVMNGNDCNTITLKNLHLQVFKPHIKDHCKCES